MTEQSHHVWQRCQKGKRRWAQCEESEVPEEIRKYILSCKHVDLVNDKDWAYRRVRMPGKGES